MRFFLFFFIQNFTSVGHPDGDRLRLGFGFRVRWAHDHLDKFMVPYTLYLPSEAYCNGEGVEGVHVQLAELVGAGGACRKFFFEVLVSQ